MRIFIFESDEDTSHLLNHTIRSLGHEVTIGDNGLLVFTKGFDHPEMIIIDSSIEGFSAPELCRKLKTTADLNHIHVIILSGAAQVTSACHSAGADAILSKPFKLEQLKITIQDLRRKLRGFKEIGECPK